MDKNRRIIKYAIALGGVWSIVGNRLRHEIGRGYSVYIDIFPGRVTYTLTIARDKRELKTYEHLPLSVDNIKAVVDKIERRIES